MNARSLATAARIYPDGPLFGQKLDRGTGLRHPRITEFWAAVDFILESDMLLRRHLYG